MRSKSLPSAFSVKASWRISYGESEAGTASTIGSAASTVWRLLKAGAPVISSLNPNSDAVG